VPPSQVQACGISDLRMRLRVAVASLIRLEMTLPSGGSPVHSRSAPALAKGRVCASGCVGWFLLPRKTALGCGSRIEVIRQLLPWCARCGPLSGGSPFAGECRIESALDWVMATAYYSAMSGPSADAWPSVSTETEQLVIVTPFAAAALLLLCCRCCCCCCQTITRDRKLLSSRSEYHCLID